MLDDYEYSDKPDLDWEAAETVAESGQKLLIFFDSDGNKTDVSAGDVSKT